MSDLSQMIVRVLSYMGRFQISIILLLSVNSIIVAINHTLTSFHTYTPTFFCKENNLTTGCSNGTCEGGYIFNEHDDTTIVTEWSLVCSRKFLGPLVNTMYFMGVTLGAIVCGSLCDRWGRRILIVVCLYSQGILGFLLYFTNSLELFIVVRVLQGFFVQGLQGCTYTLLLEFCPARFRTAAGVIWEIFWATGLIVLGSMSYLIHDWRVLQMVLAGPTIMTLLYIWLIPESPCWLLATNQLRKAMRLNIKIARLNKDQSFLEEFEQEPLNDTNRKSAEENAQSNGELNKKVTLIDVAKVRVLRKHAMVMVTIWFCVTLSYYGTLFYLPNLTAGGRHENFIIGAAIEILAYIIAYFVLGRLGRRIPMATYQVINGMICLTIATLTIVSSYTEPSEWKSFLVTALTLLSKGLCVSSFCGMFIYASELFPTVCRGAVIGLCGLAARIGSLSAPQLLLLGDYTHPSLPMIIMGITIIISGTATLLLPETLNELLPNSIMEAINKWDIS